MVHNRRPNVIIAVAPPFLIGFLAIMAKIRFGQRIPIIYHVQDLQVDAAIDLRMLPRWLTKPLLLLERLQLRLVDQVTTVSNGMLQRLRSKGPTKRSIKLWKNWADCSAIQPQADGATAEYRNLLNLLDNDCLVLYSGNLGKKQGLDDLLDAIDRLRECEKLHWVIAGQGAERQHLEEKAKELNLPRLTFMDLQPLEKLPAFLCAADIHVIPQKAVAADLVMPSKLLNILAVARPVIACAAPGTELHTVISEAQCGKTCAPEDPKALADAIQSYYLATDERLLAGTMGRVYVEEELDKPKVLGKAMELFQSLITETRR
jgi:colanic acid biosynthesis glycosyl transferase WcaI